MKKTLILLILTLGWLGSQESYAQIWAGTHNSTYGELRLIEESWPNGKFVVYGDYKGDGTVVGEMDNGGREYRGDFHNGSWKGKFFFDRSFVLMGSRQSENFSFKGFFGTNTDNRNSTRPQDKWDGNRVNIQTLGRIRTAVWSGRWNTNFDPIFLEQIGNEVTGTYGNGNRIEGTYNPSDRKLRGKFVQGGRVGSFEFTITGNDFTGIWGWGAMLNEGSWNGTKFTKSNVNMPALASSSPSLAGRYRVRIQGIYTDIKSGVFYPNVDIFGQADVQMFSKPNNGSRVEIRARNNQSKRIWSLSNSNLLRINQSSPLKSLQNGPMYAGRHAINRTIEFDVSNNLGNENLQIIISGFIMEKQTLSTVAYKPTNLEVFIKDLVPNRTYFFTHDRDGDKVYITFTIEKL
ncbi:hypothetical protein MM213_08470 [Belliella sp. R4-6]|uniref:MORN repeat-containing protein n=1 Tax=Belliella alkalica TaxID=1730871 RepID=A0ABS9VC43_9BACT|nr:hypothetical protein [Belliella alkalica]MCH7413515.1 hypothetical protein [Belliella alkalica]